MSVRSPRPTFTSHLDKKRSGKKLQENFAGLAVWGGKMVKAICNLGGNGIRHCGSFRWPRPCPQASFLKDRTTASTTLLPTYSAPQTCSIKDARVIGLFSRS